MYAPKGIGALYVRPGTRSGGPRVGALPLSSSRASSVLCMIRVQVIAANVNGGV
jgi:hypothetical protein